MSIVLAVVAGADNVAGGGTVAFIFVVGAGHVALQQIKVRGERGAILAYIALGISYLIATYALVLYVALRLAFMVMSR